MKWFDTMNRSTLPFQFFIGGRGIGKTYSALSHSYDDYKNGKCGKIFYIRMTNEEMDLCASDAGNPYKAINTDKNINVTMAGNDKLYTINDCNIDGDIIENIGYASALGRAGKIRGASFNDVDLIYFDEFIPAEAIVKTPVLKQCGYLFIQLYETANRNRELQGKPPIKCIFTANAFSIENDILVKFGVVETIERMLHAREKRASDRERGVYVELCDAQEVTEAKRNTALYKAISSSEARRIALENKFGDVSLNMVRKNIPISEYFPIWSYSNSDKSITCYVHKTLYKYYIVSGLNKSVPKDCRFNGKTQGIFISRYWQKYHNAVFDCACFFDSVETKLFTETVLDKNIKL